MTLYLGIDVGTSGCRSCLIDDEGRVNGGIRRPLPAPVRHGDNVEQDPEIWWNALTDNLDLLKTRIDLSTVAAVCIDATSATLLLCDDTGTPVTRALMYNDARATDAAKRIASAGPGDSAAQGSSSGLAKLLWLLQTASASRASHALHQADWLLGRLGGQFGISDENNALKLGYDPVARCWPEWLDSLPVPRQLLPEVVPAGQTLSRMSPGACHRWGFRADTRLVSGTTDSTAGFIATGAGPGDAVTTLGSTLVLKIYADRPVFAPGYGIYSQRLGNHWLVGGASNSGGAVLRRFFSDSDISGYTECVQPDQPAGLDYYPLPAPGERFPVNDPTMLPRLDPRPDDDALFFQAILEGMASIEATGYELLEKLGAPKPDCIITSGGGAVNEPWRIIRERLLGVPVITAKQQQAAYGAALLAMRSGPLQVRA